MDAVCFLEVLAVTPHFIPDTLAFAHHQNLIVQLFLQDNNSEKLKWYLSRKTYFATPTEVVQCY